MCKSNIPIIKTQQLKTGCNFVKPRFTRDLRVLIIFDFSSMHSVIFIKILRPRASLVNNCSVTVDHVQVTVNNVEVTAGDVDEWSVKLSP